MKITLLKENLKAGLGIVEKITGKDLTLPILNNVLISTDKNFLNLATTNLEIGINYWTLSKVEKEGKIAIPAKFLYNFISFLSEEKITLETKDTTLFINCGSQKAQIKGLKPDEFPIIPKIESENFITINALPFLKGISQVIDFCSATQVKPELSGIYFRIQKDRIVLVSTDSFRLTEKTLFFKELPNSINFDKNKEYSFIVPQRTIREIINILSEKTIEGNQDLKLKIYFSSNQILFEFLTSDSNPKTKIHLVSRLIEGEYPNYEEIIPKKYKTEVILSKDVFLNQIKTTGLFSGKVNEVKIKALPDKNKIEIFSQHPEFGENKSDISCKVKGDTVQTSFNYKFLVDGLSNIKTQELIFEMNGEDGPAALKPLGDNSYIYIVMPIKAS